MQKSENCANRRDAPEPRFNPFLPLPLDAGRTEGTVAKAGINQRARRAHIRAVTRRLLTEKGCAGVTVREIAKASGFALQTIYNLVGPRDQVLCDAMIEYALYVGRISSQNHSGSTLSQLIDGWIESVEYCPEYARQCNLIYLDSKRNVYYRFIDAQIRGISKLLRYEQKKGRIVLNENPKLIATQVVFYSNAIWCDWADRQVPLSVIRERLASGLFKLIKN